ncbi:MAG TPA: class I SAM-dependent methyltransferase [Novosphingobium sp.]
MSDLASTRDHAALMDAVYRGQRQIYDVTRKFFLFGRDSLIAGLKCEPGDTVLEIGCGTGRNLSLIARRWPGAALYGLDISVEMLASAQAKLGRHATLACGDATDFDAGALFGREKFDRVVISFALSMIPDWQTAIEQGLRTLSPTGTLHMVDFGDSNGLPCLLRTGLNAWLHRFHVTPRLNLGTSAAAIAARHGRRCHMKRGPMDYYWLLTVGPI